MSDIFDEVEEDLRREKLKSIWSRIAPYVIGTAVLIVVVVAGYRGYVAWTTSQARAAGDAFLVEIEAADNGTRSGEDLLAYAANAPDGYALLARFRAATEAANAGNSEAARTTLSGIATDSGVSPVFQDLATIRLGHVALDENDTDATRMAVGGMAENAGATFHRAAQELMGLAAYVDEDFSEARRWFSTLSSAVGVPPALRQRSGIMLELIDQVAPAAPAEATAEGTEGPDGEETN